MNQLSSGRGPAFAAVLGIAGVAGGLGTIAYSYVYAFTHGSSTVNQMGVLLGMNEIEWGRLAVILPFLLWAALLAFRLRIGGGMNRLAVIGYRMISIGLALRILSELPQWFIDMREDYQTFLGIGSWILYVLTLPVQSVGMVLMAIGCRRSRKSGSTWYAAMFVGLLILPTLIAGGILSELSDDSTIYRWGMVLLSIPQGLAWSWLAIVRDKGKLVLQNEKKGTGGAIHPEGV